MKNRNTAYTIWPKEKGQISYPKYVWNFDIIINMCETMKILISSVFYDHLLTKWLPINIRSFWEIMFISAKNFDILGDMITSKIIEMSFTPKYNI